LISGSKCSNGFTEDKSIKFHRQFFRYELAKLSKFLRQNISTRYLKLSITIKKRNINSVWKIKFYTHLQLVVLQKTFPDKTIGLIHLVFAVSLQRKLLNISFSCIINLRIEFVVKSEITQGNFQSKTLFSEHKLQDSYAASTWSTSSYDPTARENTESWLVDRDIAHVWYKSYLYGWDSAFISLISLSIPLYFI